MADLLANGSLVTVLPDFALPAVPLSMPIVPERASVARVRLLIDFLAGRIAKVTGISKVSVSPAE